MVVISFDSTNFAMMADKCLSEEHFEKMVIPTPRAISNSCGISLMIEEDSIEGAKKIIKYNNLTIKGIFKIENNICEQIL